jgi:hypothetical protein
MERLKKYINEALKNILPNLISNELSLIINYTFNICNIIRYKFGITNIDKYIEKLIENDYRDIIAIIFMLLPYIDDKNNFELFKKINKLNDIYILKKDNISEKFIYEISNIQYNRCNIININNKLESEEEEFKLEYLEQNYKLLCRTIDRIGNKLYVNWINVRPMTILDYKDSIIYKSTIANYNENNINEMNINKLNLDYQLHIGDIYDTIYNYLYMEIKHQKWLLFETLVNNTIMPYVQVLNIILPLNNLIQEKRWLELTNEEKYTYSLAWDNIISAIKNKQNIRKINYTIIENIFRQIILYFDKRARTNKDLIESNLYIPLINHEPITEIIEKINLKIDEDEENNNEDELNNEILKLLNSLDINYLLKSIDTTPISEIYNFLLYNIKKLKQTWYGKQLFYEKENIAGINRNTDLYQDMFKQIINNKIIGDYDFKLSLKNIYNFAKSFSHYQTKNKWELFPKKYIMLSSRDKEEIQNRLKNPLSNNSNYFMSITNNIRRLYPFLPKGDVEALNSIIYITIHNNIIDIVFQTLIHKGILSTIHFNSELTNLNLIPDTYSEKVKHYTNKLYQYVFNKQNRKKYENTNYFLTTKPYKLLNKVRINKEKIKDYLDILNFNDIENSVNILKYQLTEISYFDDLTINHAWYRFYAMDWICQISFYHHYINNSIMYVTGATGQGKSTQAPKLFLYALKIIDYNVNGKVVCSVPRIAPTLDNSEQIASQMGVHYEQLEGTREGKIRSNNFYVQFAYQEDKHQSNNEDYYISIQTDGKLIEDFYKNITLKKNIVNEKDTFNKGLITVNNTYDIVMIDESHEHNRYMDLLLTLGRNTVYYNNSIKLVVVSATIDQDEPIYRRYYRCINDNLIYPYTYELKEFKLDRANVDRRYHIAPPGGGTQHPIQDIYINSNPTDNNNDVKKAYEANEKLAIDTIVKICNENREGDILVFSIGKAEINRLVEELLKQTGEHILIYPFFKEMTEEWKNKVSKISNYLPIFTFDRSQIMNIVLSDDKPIDKVNYGTYKKAIIIATPIAEASITIDSLKYVVDIGYNKTAKYNVLLQNSELNIQKITESSRLQRRGRVGRVSSGTVYYMYEKNSRKYITPEYQICNENITDVVYKLIASSYENKKLIDNITYKKFIKDKQNYYYDTNKTLYEGITNINVIKPPDYYEDGFHMENVYDIDGRFYLVHPRENLSYRNELTGAIIQSYRYDIKKYVDTNILNVSEFKIMMDSLLYSQKIIDLNIFDEIDFLSEYTEKLGFVYTEIKNMKITKTEISHGIDKISQKINSIDITYEIILTILYAIKYNIYDQVLIIIICLLSCNNDLANWYGIISSKTGKEIKEDKKFKKIYGNLDSDYLFFIKFFEILKISFPDLIIFKERITADEILNHYEIELNEFIKLKNEQLNEYSIPKSFSNYTLKKYNKFNGFMNNDILNNDSSKEKIINEARKTNKYIDILEQQINEINFKEWCNNNHINYITFIKFLKKYYYFTTIFLSVKDNLNKLADKLVIDSIDSSININIIKCFFQTYGRKTQLAYYLPEKSQKHSTFFLVNRGDTDYFSKIKSLLRNEYIPDTLVYTYPEVILYHTSRYDESSNLIDLGIISKIDTNWISLLLPHIFNRKNMKESKSNIETINKTGLKIININLNNISYLIDIDDKFLKQYYKDLINKLNNLYGGSIKMKSFSSYKLKFNPQIYKLIKDYNLNIINTIDRIYFDNYNVNKLYARGYNRIFYKIL